MNAELARRAVACKHWRWMPGMKVMSDPQAIPAVIGCRHVATETTLRAIITEVNNCGRMRTWSGVSVYSDDWPDIEFMSGDDLPGTLPDLTDPATLGCLLHLVREARQDPSWQPYVAFYGGEAIWWLEQPSQFRQTSHESYASVLIAALEAAP